MTAYTDALARVLVHEGGKVDDPRDPGGRTNQGVIQRVYNAWRERKGLATRDVYLMTNAERDDIYRAQYWDAIKGDKLPVGVSYVVFDGAVNSGPKQSIKWLQRALGIAADGVIGEVTMAALANDADNDKLIAAIADRRLAFLKALKTFPRFGKGWVRRVDGVLAAGQAMASGSIAPPAHFFEGGNAKANIDDAKKPLPKGAADAAAGGGAGVGLALGGIKDQLEPYTSASRYIEMAVIGLIIAAGAISVGALVYRMWAAKQKAKLADALDVAL